MPVSTPVGHRVSHHTHAVFSIAGSMVYYDPVADETTIYNIGDIGFIITAMALVWLMVPGVGFFYSGLLRRKNALSMIWTSLASIAVVSFQVRTQCASRSPVSLTCLSGSSGVILCLSLKMRVPSLAPSVRLYFAA